MTNLTNIKRQIEGSGLGYCHFTLAQYLAQSYQDVPEFCLWLAVLVNLEVANANVCLDISSIEDKSRELGWNEIPNQQQLLELLDKCPFIGAGKDNLPLVKDRGKLYLNRYYHHEKIIADFVLRKKQPLIHITDEEICVINQLFPDHQDRDIQKMAAIVSYVHPLSIISGGPGTGKSYTVGKILALFIKQQSDINIQLAAPTGKAAMRLSRSIAGLREQLPLDSTLKNSIPDQALTLHRLLGINRYTHRPKYNGSNPLDCDILIVDEASMVDQQMMAQICDALPQQARLILLGDKDQLSSVEAGSVFADLCGGIEQTAFNKQQQDWIQHNWGYALAQNQTTYALADQVVVLEQSYRFDPQSGIGKLARLINQGETDACMELLARSEQEKSVNWVEIKEGLINASLSKQADGVYQHMLDTDSIEQAFSLFHQYQILAAVWSGPTGVNNINEQVEHYLKLRSGIGRDTKYYKGQPLMMTQNVYQYDLFNGDVGIVWPDQNGQLKVWFEGGQGNFRVLSISQLPAHISAYAMTVHKSQGSEFEHILLILPFTESEILTRELIYTAITRASRSVEIWGHQSIIRCAVAQRTKRASGLMQRLQDE